jgi:hypothetical protein
MGTKLTALLLLVGLAPLGLMAWYANSSASNSILNAAREELAAIRDIKQHQVELYFKNQQSNMVDLVDLVSSIQGEAFQNFLPFGTLKNTR